MPVTQEVGARAKTGRRGNREVQIGKRAQCNQPGADKPGGTRGAYPVLQLRHPSLSLSRESKRECGSAGGARVGGSGASPA